MCVLDTEGGVLIAIDTEAKRRSAMAVGAVALLMLPLADGTVGTGDRAHVCGIYAGISIGSAVAESVTLFDGVDGLDQMVVLDLGDDNLQRVWLTGIMPSGDDIILRFVASRGTQYVAVHIQHDGGGNGGEVYDNVAFVSDERVDCTSNRQQDTTIPRTTGNDYYVWLVPEFLETDATFTRFDGEAGEGVDRMAFVALGANSKKIEAMRSELENIRELLERLARQAATVTGLDLGQGEK